MTLCPSVSFVVYRQSSEQTILCKPFIFVVLLVGMSLLSAKVHDVCKCLATATNLAKSLVGTHQYMKDY